MQNAKSEFLEQIKNRGLVCAKLILGDVYSDDRKVFALKQKYTESDLESFLKSIDFLYDNGFGGQELFGFIWHTDTTWSERYEYDGAESWDYKEIPAIPDDLN